MLFYSEPQSKVQENHLRYRRQSVFSLVGHGQRHSVVVLKHCLLVFQTSSLFSSLLLIIVVINTKPRGQEAYLKDQDTKISVLSPRTGGGRHQRARAAAVVFGRRRFPKAYG